eukprot:TRINITY_DN2500_c0_g1_i3.p1 TRINITY_DN2500_c0_g1~~TRINITY_DN2500_c0_g1_i3.p1  ORF type:complete len:686 (+),score=50.56 TRINITY_DN2500_c0_g1_i3:130-2187(+)
MSASGQSQGFGQLQVQLSNVLESKGIGRQVHVTFQNLNAWVPLTIGNTKIIKLWRENQSIADQNYKQILYNIGGQVHPGQILALMGPSGSGKTSLLSILGGRAPEMVKQQGQVLFNGKHLTKNVKRNLGFVLQDDLLFPTLNVLETLTFAAYLRLPRDMSFEDKKSRVGDVISALGLESCKDTIVGDAFRRGVSGGERKRVSVGHELITNPSVVFLDEPTSGLDSTTALKLIETLRDLSQGGRTIITTIHQPASRLYQQLDKLLLLCEGHVMFYGSAHKVATWFGHLGFQVPFGINIADHILDLANGDVPSSKLGKDEVKKHLIAVSETYLQHRPADGFTDDKDLQMMRVSIDQHQGIDTVSFNSTRQWSDLELAGEDRNELESDDSKDGTNSEGKDLGIREGAGYMTQLWVLWLRSFKTRRFEALGYDKLLLIALVSIISGCLWWQVGEGDSLLDANDVVSLLFFQGVLLSFLALFAALFTFPPEFRLLLKERASGMYRLSAYYFSRTASDVPLTCLYPSVFVVIIYWMAGLRANAGIFLAQWMGVLLMVLLAESIGLLLGASVMDSKAAQTMASVLMLTVMLVGGFMVRDVPDWADWLKYLSFVYWGYSFLIKLQFQDKRFTDCGEFGLERSKCEEVDDIREALVLPRDIHETPMVEIGVLLGMLIFFRVAVYFVLNTKTRQA